MRLLVLLKKKSIVGWTCRLKRLIKLCLGKYGGADVYLTTDEVSSVTATKSKICYRVFIICTRWLPMSQPLHR